MGEIFKEGELERFLEYLHNRTEEDIEREKKNSEGDMWVTFIDPDTDRPFSVYVNERRGITLEKFFSGLGETEKHRIINYGQKDEQS